MFPRRRSLCKRPSSTLRKTSLSPITLRDVADVVHLNASYLSVLFKKETGMTFQRVFDAQAARVGQAIAAGHAVVR